MIESPLKIEPWTVIIDQYAGRSSERIKIARCSDKKRSERGPGEGGEGGGGSIVFDHLNCFPWSNHHLLHDHYHHDHRYHQVDSVLSLLERVEPEDCYKRTFCALATGEWVYISQYREHYQADMIKTTKVKLIWWRQLQSGELAVDPPAGTSGRERWKKPGWKTTNWQDSAGCRIWSFAVRRISCLNIFFEKLENSLHFEYSPTNLILKIECSFRNIAKCEARYHCSFSLAEIESLYQHWWRK